MLSDWKCIGLHIGELPIGCNRRGNAWGRGDVSNRRMFIPLANETGIGLSRCLIIKNGIERLRAAVKASAPPVLQTRSARRSPLGRNPDGPV